ncbi:DUF3299 domain-containing protein [Oxalobacteraceae bacterium CAVE-383]|nr:DUF3299 domain-containing protein [Oxalobacteraceae bacterium CAVE-383]
MKVLAWFIALIGSGLLIGHLASRFVSHSNANEAAPLSAAAQTTNAASAQAPASSQYKVGDRLAQTAAPAPAKSPYRQILWDALMPADWDPMLPFKGLKLDTMQDGDPRAQQALWKAKKYWNKAPTNPKIDNVAVKIPGFVVSLEREGDALTEFLVVPYYGGCIHVPPPPLNQIIHVHSNKPIEGIRTMDAVWISGTLKIGTTETMMGVAGYNMLAQNVELYTEAPDAPPVQTQ